MTHLDYESPQPPRGRLRWAPDVAVAITVTATLSLGVSVFMFVSRNNSGLLESVQKSLAWISIALAAAGLVATVLACFVKPRSAYLWISVAVLSVYALVLFIALGL